MAVARNISVASGGRFLPTITVTKYGAGTYQITDYNSGYRYPITATSGPAATRATNILTLSQATSESTVKVGPPKEGIESAVVNIKRTPYTFFSYNNATNYCSSHHGDGQCSGNSTHNVHSGPFKSSTPASHTDSNGEWWRIW